MDVMGSMEELTTDVMRVRSSINGPEFVRIVKNLSETGMSVRSISALTNRPKSVVDRAVRAPQDDVAIAWKRTPLPVLYDVFREAATTLLASYLAFQRKAKTDEEQQLWAELRRGLIETRDAVSSQDREHMVTLIEQWSEEAARLRGLRKVST